MDFPGFCDAHCRLLFGLLRTAQDRVNEILCMDYTEMDPNVEAVLMHSAFFRACRNQEKALKAAGFQVVHSGTPNEKRWLYHGEENVILRFGKMSEKGMMAKCQTKIDRDFAKQSETLFPDLPLPLHAYIGYTSDPREIMFTDMILAIPKDETSNSYIWRYSEISQPELVQMPHQIPAGRGSQGNGFKERLIAMLSGKGDTATGTD